MLTTIPYLCAAPCSMSTLESIRSPHWSIMSERSSFGLVSRRREVVKYTTTTADDTRSQEAPLTCSAQHLRLPSLRGAIPDPTRAVNLGKVPPAVPTGASWGHHGYSSRAKPLSKTFLRFFDEPSDRAVSVLVGCADRPFGL